MQSVRHIVHLDLDAFYVSVEYLRQPQLKGKPVLIGGSSDRGVVASCSYEARKFGIHSAMAMKTARRLCPHAIILPGDHESYGRYSRLVTDIISSRVPIFEKSSIDEFYIDLTGMDRFFGCLKFAAGLKQCIRQESGLTVSWALSTNKLVSKVATNEVKPDGQVEVPPGTEKAYLAPLSVMKIPGVGQQTGQRLMAKGFRTIGDLSEAGEGLLRSLLGRSGEELWRRANGIDEAPVVPYREQKSISTENTFGEDIVDDTLLHAALVRMIEKIAFDLRQQQKLAGCVTVKLRYSNFETFTRQQTIGYSNADHILLQTARDLFSALHTRGRPVRLLGVRFSHLIPGNYQIDLFNDREEMIKLYQAIDSVKRRYGTDALQRGGGN